MQPYPLPIAGTREEDETTAVISAALTAAACALAAGGAVLTALLDDGSRTPRHQRPHPRAFVLYEVPSYSDSDFLQAFRLPRRLVDYLTAELAVEPAFVVAPRAARSAAPLSTLVLIALFRLAHTVTTKQIALRFAVDEAAVDFASWTVIPLIASKWRSLINDGWPRTSAARASAAAAWATRRGCLLPDVLGAMGGVHVPVFVPAGALHETFYNVKGFFSITFMHIVDAHCRTIYLCSGVAGSSSDCTKLSQSKLWNDIAAWVPDPYHLLVDGGLPNRTQLIAPYDRGTADAQRVLFNRVHSNGRIAVEKAFGLIKNRWRMFYGKTGVQFRDGHGLSATQKYRECWYAATILTNMVTTYNMQLREQGTQPDALDREIESEAESDAAEEIAAQERRESDATFRAHRAAELAEDGLDGASPTAANAVKMGEAKRDELLAYIMNHPDRPPL